MTLSDTRPAKVAQGAGWQASVDDGPQDSQREEIKRRQALFLVFLATGVDARNLTLGTDELKRLVVRSQQTPLMVRDDLINRGGVPTDADRTTPATLDKVWRLVRAAKVCLAPDGLSMADAEYLLAESEAAVLHSILLPYAHGMVKRHKHPATSAMTWALKARTGEDVRDRGLTMAEASFLLDVVDEHLRWTVQAIRAIPSIYGPACEPVSIDLTGDHAVLPIPASIAQRFPPEATFGVEVTGDGVFYRRIS